MSANSLRSDCRKFIPNIFNKTKCSNCFKQKEEHTPEALECNRASRKVSKNGYLFVAPNWDFSIPLNRTKRWQRRWFVLYDDGELNYSVDEHPDTVPQASIDMTHVLEVTSAEEVTGHAFSLAITAPDRVTFVKALTREDARNWTNMLSVYTRNKGRHKRNATFPGGQTTTIHQPEALPRSGTPNPIRPRYNSCHSDSSVRTLIQSSSSWKQGAAQSPVSQIDTLPGISGRREGAYDSQPASSASPPTRDKLKTEEKTAARTRHLGQQQQRTGIIDIVRSSAEYEKLKDIAAVLTSPRTVVNPPATIQTPTRDSDSTDKEDNLVDVVDGGGISAEIHVELPAEGLLNLKKGWLMQQTEFNSNWSKRWFVLCGHTLTAYRDPDSEDSDSPEMIINLSSISAVLEVQVARNYGFQLKLWNDVKHILSAVTSGIRLNWIMAIRKAAGLDESQSRIVNKPPVPGLERNLSNNSVELVRTPSTPKSLLFSSDEEYKTASEGGRRESGDWGDGLTALPPSPPLNRTPISRVKERTRSRSSSRSRLYKRSRSSPPSSRTSTLDSVSTEDLMQACCQVTELEPDLSDPAIIELLEAEVQALRNQLDDDTVQQQRSLIEELRKKLCNAVNELNSSEQELVRLRQIQTESVLTLKKTEQQLKLRTAQLEDMEALKLVYQKDKDLCETKMKEKDELVNETLKRYELLKNDYLTKQRINISLQEEINILNDRLCRGIEENDYLYKKLQDLDGKDYQCSAYGSLSDLTNIDLDLDLENITKENLKEEYNNLKFRFEKAVNEIKTMKRELRNSHMKFDDLELVNITLRQDFKRLQDDNQAQNGMMAARIQDLTTKLTASEKQVRNLKSKLQDSREKRRSLSLKGKESFSLNKDIEDKIFELEAKILSLEKDNAHGAVSKKAIRRDRSSERDDRSQRRLRRKSLDSITTTEPMKVLIHLSSLESKVANISEPKPISSSSQEFDSNNRILVLESILEAARQKLNEVIISKHSQKTCDRERTLLEVRNILKSDISAMEVGVIKESVLSVVQSFEQLLRNKLQDLANKRQSLKEAGKLTAVNSVHILAEKLAYEAVIMSHIRNALHCENLNKYTSRILQRELLETSHLVKSLQNKLTGSLAKKYSISKISEEHLTQILTRRLIQIGFITNNNRQNDKKQDDITKGLEYLLDKQKDLDLLLQKYKSSKLEQLASTLALETLNTDCSLNKHAIKEAWKTAQETVSAELIQSEISHVMLRCAQMYENNININQRSFFTFLASERASLELWSDSVEEKFRTEMERNIEELTTAYNNCLAKLRQQRRRIEQEKNFNKSRQLLAEFADVIVHKALIDSRIAVLTDDKQISPVNTARTAEKPPNGFVKNLIDSEQYLSIMEDCEVLESDLLLDSEFQYLFQHYSKNCESDVNAVNLSHLQQISDGLNGIESEVNKLYSFVKMDTNGAESDIQIKSWNDVCQKCAKLQNRLNYITGVVLSNKMCTQCEHLRDSLSRLSQKHEAEVALLRQDQERDLVVLRGELEHERASLVTQHETEQAQLKERARMLERRLGTLDNEYTQQLEQLRSAYRDTLSPCLESASSGEDNLRQRYQTEIEQLRTLCEKGLLVVENSHRRVVAELEDKHRRERDQLRLEKEQALAEETQATLAALDAMRKAHESEVRREVSKFKQDFLRKMQSTHDIGALHKEHEAEMQEIKKEILSLSERYSVKCVESASLEEQLCNISKQLAQAHQHIQHLDARNHQLRAHFLSEAKDTNTSDDLTYRQPRLDHLEVNRAEKSAGEICKSKINTIRNPQLSLLQMQ